MKSETENSRGKRGGGRAYRSRVEPFVDFIREQRRQRKTWQEIAECLGAEQGFAITFEGLHQFYRRHLKRRTRPHWEDGLIGAQPTRPNGTASPPQASEPVLASTPAECAFRRPNPSNIILNDPTKP